MSPLTRTPIRELRRRILAGELSSVTIARDCIRQRKLHDPILHAFHQVDDDAMLQSAAEADAAIHQQTAGALAGIPMSVKSVIGVSGYRCYAGAATALPPVWEQQGLVMELLRREGAMVSGITHAAELAVGGLGVNPHWGTPRNPWDTDNHRVPGGSSSGAAISIWEGACAFALGTDTGGSVRVPASMAGLVGLKVTADRWPMSGVVPLASRFDTIGVAAHTVDDVLQVFTCIDNLHVDSGKSWESIRALRLPDYNFIRASELCWRNLDPGIEEAISTALQELETAGMRNVSDDGGIFEDAARLRDEGPNTAAIECNRLLNTELSDLRPHLSGHVKEFLASESTVSAEVYRSRLSRLVQWRREVSERLGPLDIFYMPTVMVTPPVLDQLEDREEYVRYSDGLLHNTVLASINGLCAITIPVGLDRAGMPVGLQLVAPAYTERTLLHAARLLESVLGTGIERLGLPGLAQR